MQTNQLYKIKDKEYFSNVREDLISCLDINSEGAVLEIGAGSCDTLVAIKERKLAQEVVGVELCALPNSNQQNPILDQLHICSVEESIQLLETNHFDAIICGDVLEHLVDPWVIINKLVSLLKNDGLLIVSVPNFREVKNLTKILFTGRFEYKPSGIMDKTHLRFFCRKNLIDLVTNESLVLVSAFGNYHRLGWRKSVRYLHLGLLDEFLTFQNISVSKKI